MKKPNPRLAAPARSFARARPVFWFRRPKAASGVLLGVLVLAALAAAFHACPARAAKQAAKAKPVPSRVAPVNDRPALLINGQPLRPAFVEIYNFPDELPEHANQPPYASPKWLAAACARLDQAAAGGASLVLVHVWWSDLDSSQTPPHAGQSLASRLDFANLDAFMDHARKRGLAVVPILGMNHFAPPWWMRHHRFPETAAANVLCDFCETDSLGVSYNNPDMGAPVVRQDLGEVLRAVIRRYRAHPALVGWSFGLGPTGEDFYGPNYILIKGLGGFAKVGEKPLRITGYSPFFIREFARWLKARYGDSAALAKAWNDPDASLDPFVMPPPAQLVANPASFGLREFPDASFDAFGDNPGLLTVKGRDFYQFRQDMRASETDFYARLIKEADPDHVLIFKGLLRESLREHPLVDGLLANPHLDFTGALFGERHQLWKYLTAVKAITDRGKLALLGMEDSSRPDSSGVFRDSPAQLDYLETFAKSTLCAGGMFGYDVDLLDKAQGPLWLPTWHTPEAQDLAQRLASYQPGPDCACSLVSAMYRRQGCADPGRPKGCGLLDKAYASLCNAPLPPGVSLGAPGAMKPGQNGQGQQAPPGMGGHAPGQGAGRCGDGTCGPMERKTGLCPADCPN